MENLPASVKKLKCPCANVEIEYNKQQYSCWLKVCK